MVLLFSKIWRTGIVTEDLPPGYGAPVDEGALLAVSQVSPGPETVCVPGLHPAREHTSGGQPRSAEAVDVVGKILRGLVAESCPLVFHEQDREHADREPPGARR